MIGDSFRSRIPSLIWYWHSGLKLGFKLNFWQNCCIFNDFFLWAYLLCSYEFRNPCANIKIFTCLKRSFIKTGMHFLFLVQLKYVTTIVYFIVKGNCLSTCSEMSSECNETQNYRNNFHWFRLNPSFTVRWECLNHRYILPLSIWIPIALARSSCTPGRNVTSCHAVSITLLHYTFLLWLPRTETNPFHKSRQS